MVFWPGSRPIVTSAGSQLVLAPVTSVARRAKVDWAVWSSFVAVTSKVAVDPGVKAGRATLVLVATVTVRLARPRSAWTRTCKRAGGPGSSAWMAQAGGPGAILVTNASLEPPNAR